jgi:HEPN domain-containing protein
MQPDQARLADTAAWLAKARLDLRSAEHALTASEPLHEDVAFHSQQAVEKSFKALLTLHDIPFRKTHSIEELGRQCLTIDPSLRTLVDQAAPLSQYAWRFRYPGEEVQPTADEARESLQIARQVFGAILDRLPPDAHPKTR